MPRRILKIAIDARAASHPQPGGFKTYTRGLIKGLNQVDGDNHFVLLADRHVDDNDWPTDTRFETRVVYGGPPLLGAGLREQLILPLLLRHEQPDVAHFLCNTGPFLMPRASVVTIHDLAPILYPSKRPVRLSWHQWKQFAIRSYARLLLPGSARQAAAIITDSEASKRDLVNRLGLRAGKISVIPLAYDECFKPRSGLASVAHIRQRCNEARGFVLTLGSLTERKNTAAAIQAFIRLPQNLREHYPLVVILTDHSAEAFLANLVAQAGCRSQVHFIPGPKDPKELASWYNAAQVFVMPSLYEGFGIPVLEAMACGTPVVSSNTSSLPEVAGDAALLVDPCDSVAVSHAIQAVLENDALYADLRARGMQRAALFSWERTARETLAVYEEVHRRSHNAFTLEVA